MGFGAAIASCFRNYANFRDRAPRSEFWFFRLFLLLVFAGFFLVIGAIGAANERPHDPNPVAMGLSFALIIFWLAIFIPDLAVTVRRLHDVNRSGWWYLLAIVPFGSFMLLFWSCMKGTQGENDYGPDPFGSSAHVFD